MRAHRQHVFDEAIALLDAHPFWERKYSIITGDDLRYRLKRVAWWHDAGKAHQAWSEACRADYEIYQRWRVDEGLPAEEPDDKQNAKDFKRYETARRALKKTSGPHLMKTSLRHEFDSLAQAAATLSSDQVLSLSEQAAIAAHHGKLNHRFISRWKEDGKKDEKNSQSTGPYYQYWQQIDEQQKTITAFRARDEWQTKVMERYRTAALRALLQLADTRASRRESGGEVPDLATFKYKFPYDKPRDVQEAVLKGADLPVSVLRAKTGSGKTDASLLWAKHQIDNYRADRLVIAMPTRFTSNALAISVEENVSATGLYHSSAWYTRDGQLSFTEKEYARELHKLARGLATPVTVCTIDHLLLCLTGTKEDHHTSFFFLTNSAVVFDEADFYDSFVQANLMVLLEALQLLKVPVLIMSATVPDSLRVRYGIKNPILDVEAAIDTKPRQLVWRGPAETPSAVEGILKGMLRMGTGIVYANTVARAYAYYQWFLERFETGEGPEPILYHSRYTEPDKKGIEERLIKALGKDAWTKHGNASGIAILTQIGEMSVNISAPVMLSDACPWDRLVQRLGRLDRFDLYGGIATMYVVEPFRDGVSYPAPYGELLKSGGWFPAAAFSQTVVELAKDFDEVPTPVMPNQLVKRVNDLYQEQPDFTTRITQNRDRLLDLMNLNWMIVPNMFSDEDQVTVSDQWKSRDIPPQQTLFVGLPTDEPGGEQDESVYVFSSWDSYRGYELEQGISCPVYLAEMARRANQLVPFCFKVGNDKKAEVRTVYLVSDAYSPTIGLAALGKELPKKRERSNFG